MPGLLPDTDPDGLLEYSVVYTDRALNHMSAKFQGVMRDISALLKEVYHARSAVVVPGSGTFGMESVARQFATGKKVLVIRNGWFSYRWTQIFDMGQIPSESIVLKARQTGPGAQAPFAPPPPPATSRSSTTMVPPGRAKALISSESMTLMVNGTRASELRTRFCPMRFTYSLRNGLSSVRAMV